MLKGITAAASDAIKDAYGSVKDFIKKRYAKVGVESLETDPSSLSRQAILKEDLERANATDDEELLALAKSLLRIVNEHSPSAIKAVSGVTFEELEAGGDILVQNIKAPKGSGLTAEKIKAGHDITFSDIEVGEESDVAHAARTNMHDFGAASNNSNILDGVLAGRDINVVRNNFVLRIEPHKTYLADPRQPWDILTQPTVSLSELREALRMLGRLEKPILISVKGTFFPAALLSSGWWEKHAKAKSCEPQWRVPLQKWLYHGFLEWGPSWGFCWDFTAPPELLTSRYFIGQLADGDEANSIPVLLPYDKAQKMYDECQGSWGGLEAEVKGLLGHRSHFPDEVFAAGMQGDSLDYCMKLMSGDRSHQITLLSSRTELYTGYLWKCVAPKAWILSPATICLDQVFFLWEHTDFTKDDALKYNLESLHHKELQIQNQFGALELLQKSCSLIDGTPIWSDREFHDLFMGKTKVI
jgi:hypothetical protein